MHRKHLDSIEESLSGKGWLNEPVEVTKTGSETIYSGGGYTILQLVMEEVTGISFDRYMEEQIMKPLGMKSSSFYNVLKTITFQKLMDILERSSLVTNLPNRLLQVLRQMLSI